MNLLDCVVTKVLGVPIEKYAKWWIEVEYNSCSRLSKTDIMLNTTEQSESIQVGHKFLA